MHNPAWTTLADKRVALFAACPQVEIVALGGSLQGASADALSDIEWLDHLDDLLRQERLDELPLL